MKITYYDKDGKEHRMNIRSDQPIFIGTEIGNTGELVEFRIDEHANFNEKIHGYAPTGKFKIKSTYTNILQGISISPVSEKEILIGPSK